MLLFHDVTNMKQVCNHLPKCIGVKLSNYQQNYFWIGVQFLKMQISCVSNVGIRKCIRIICTTVVIIPDASIINCCETILFNAKVGC